MVGSHRRGEEFTAEQIPVDDRELVLGAPSDSALRVRLPDGAESTVRDRFIILRGSEILYVSGTYAPLVPPAPE